MRVTRRQSLVAFVAVTLSIPIACDDPVEPAAPGSIEIVVLASGPDVITDALQVSVGDAIVRQLDSALEITIAGLEPGVHMVTLEGTSENCTITSTNPRSVTVESNRTTVITFTVACTVRVGSVRVTTTTTGVDLDPDGYTASVSGGPSQAVGINATTTIANVREGQRLVILSGMASNCTIQDGDARSVAVAFGATVDVAFSIQCVAAGSLEVTVSTTGVTLDPDGYFVQVAAPSVAFAANLGIESTGSAIFERLRPATDYRVTLEQVAPNCAVAGSDDVTVAVMAGSTTTVHFDVVCQTPSLMAIEREGDIYVVRTDGGGATRLTTDTAPDEQPAWSSSGRIAFVTLRHLNDYELYVMNEDGSNAVRLTTSAGADDAPSWSPDGQKIVFRSFRDVNSELYVMNADGSGLTRLTTTDAQERDPAWSSTGKIVFWSDRDHELGELYVMDADGSNVLRLTNNDSTEANPAWSPDGSRIAFSRDVDVCYYGCTADIFVINADGSNVRRLQTGIELYWSHTTPAWSPNGRLIAFTRQFCDYYGCHTASVWGVDPDGTHLSQIADQAASPAWKP